ncbi:serine O-acetyltransferase EpsC [Paracoccaceae bacterium GXU_MW_L88]
MSEARAVVEADLSPKPERWWQKDAVWDEVRAEADRWAHLNDDPVAQRFGRDLLAADSLEAAIAMRLAAILASDAMPKDALRETFLAHAGALSDTAWRDLVAIVSRDPVAKTPLRPLSFFKGFHGISAQRLAHDMLGAGKEAFAIWLQNRVSYVMNMDIHPAAPIGHGIMVDHASGLVIGETAAVGNNVSMLHGVTLGGTGKEGGDRHPKVSDGVLIGAGAKILGNIRIGECARVAAGSVVLENVPDRTTVAGVPARVVGTSGCPEPARTMDQHFHTTD